MARPGKSKHKVVVSKRTTSADALISPEQIERGVGQLLSAPSASDLAAQFRELAAQTCHGSAVGMAVIDALGGHRDEAASSALVTLAVEAPELGFVHRSRGSSGERQSVGEAVEECAGDFDDLVGRR